MPTTYAHYRFGCDACQQLPAEAQTVIQRHRSLFDFGVHGPDLLFYYKPLSKNHVNQTGYRSHERTGRDFFTQAAQTVAAASDQDAARAYLYGVLCHFALDRECHPYVEQKEQTGVSHSAIEASFDRFLMLKDRLEPVTHKVTQHLRPSQESAEVIAPFYAPLTVREVYQAEKSMRRYLNLLIAGGLKRKGLLCGMSLAGKASMGDMFVPLQQNPQCVDSDEILFSHYQDALTLYQTLFSQLNALLAGDAAALGDGFDHTFGET